jgi:hypothetical protein
MPQAEFKPTIPELEMQKEFTIKQNIYIYIYIYIYTHTRLMCVIAVKWTASVV